MNTSQGKLLITGATGFIGRHLAEEALARGLPVRLLVRDAAVELPVGAERFVGDLTRPETLRGLEADVDQVIHGAGKLGKWGVTEEELARVNVEGSLNLARRFQRHPLRRLLHLSAGGVTGPVAVREVDERYACRPATAYERTKLEAEQKLKALSREEAIPVVVARPTFTYGPGDPHKLGLFRAVQRGRFAFIGDGESVLHPVYVDDLVRGAFLALERGAVGETYILGGERPVTKRELVETIARALGVAPPTWRLPRTPAWAAATVLEALGRTLGFEPLLTRSRVMMMADNFGYSIDRARRELDYRPEVPLTEGIGRTVEAYRAAGSL